MKFQRYFLKSVFQNRGLELTRKIKSEFPSIAVLVLSMHDDVGHIMELVEAGASGYLLKNVTDKELLEAIRTVAQGKLYFSPEVAEKITTFAVQQQKKADNIDELKLTDRELEILKLIAQELSNAEIAQTLFISERTVETHRKNIFKKTATNSLVGLIKFAYANNLI